MPGPGMGCMLIETEVVTGQLFELVSVTDTLPVPEAPQSIVMIVAVEEVVMMPPEADHW